MVNVDVIKKIFDEILEKYKKTKKITVKHGVFGMNIRKVLHQITDTEEEYHALRKEIFKYYEEYRHKQTEILHIKDNDGNSYEFEGNDENVPQSDESQLKGYTVGNLYSIHNHPIPSTCFQSLNDFELNIFLNEKYSVSYGADGVFIAKNSNIPKEEYLNVEDFGTFNNPTDTVPLMKQYKYDKYVNGDYEVLNKFGQYEKEMTIQFEKDKIKERRDLFTKYVTQEKDLDKFFEESDKLYQKYFRDNIQDMTKDLNTKLKGTGVNVYHIKKGK